MVGRGRHLGVGVRMQAYVFSHFCIVLLLQLAGNVLVRLALAMDWRARWRWPQLGLGSGRRRPRLAWPRCRTCKSCQSLSAQDARCLPFSATLGVHVLAVNGPLEHKLLSEHLHSCWTDLKVPRPERAALSEDHCSRGPFVCHTCRPLPRGCRRYPGGPIDDLHELAQGQSARARAVGPASGAWCSRRWHPRSCGPRSPARGFGAVTAGTCERSHVTTPAH